MKPGCFQGAASALGPGACEATHKPFENRSLVCQTPRVSWPWALKPDILGAHLSGASLQSQGALCGLWAVCSSGRSSGFCITSWLWVAALYSQRRQWHPLQYSCLENPMDWGAWWAAVHGVAKSRTRLSDFTFTFHFHTLEKEMATHSSVLAWRIPGTAEPVGLPSMGSHRVGHDWSDLAAAAAALIVVFTVRLCLSLSHLLRSGFSLVCPFYGGLAQPAFRLLSEETVPSIAVDSVCAWGRWEQDLPFRTGTPAFFFSHIVSTV